MKQEFTNSELWSKGKTPLPPKTPKYSSLAEYKQYIDRYIPLSVTQAYKENREEY